MSEREIAIRITAKNLTDEEFAKARAAVAGLGDQMKSASELFQERWAAFAASAGAAAIGIQKAGDELRDLMSQSSAQEDALVRVNTALQAQGTFTPALAAQYAELASQFQRTTVFGDELVSEMQALLVQVGNVMPNQMEAALSAATNLASGLRIDLRTATMLVGKAFEGETGTLKRYGIVIDEAKLKAGGATAVLEAINEKFGGQAQAQAETYSGRLQQLGNQYGEVKEQAGALLARAILPLLEAFTSLPQSTQTVISAAVILGSVLGPVALGFTGIFSAVSLLMPVLAAAAPAALAGVTAALGALAPFLLPAGVIIAGITGVYLAWKNWDQITTIAQRVYEGVKTWLVDKFTAIVDWIGKKVEAVTGFFRDMYEQVVGRSYVPDMVRGVLDWFTRMGQGMVAATQGAVAQTSGLFAQLGNVVSSSLADLNRIFQAAFEGGGGVSGAVQSFATRLVGDLLRQIPVVGEILSQFSGAIVAGAKKIWGALTGLFGGPDATEREGRTVAAQFREQLEQMLTDTQRLEAGNERWKQSVIAVRDAYLAAGRTEQEALAIMDRLWKAEKQGGDAVRLVIQEIEAVMRTGLTPASQAFGETFVDATARAGAGLTALGSLADEVKAEIAKPITIKVGWDIANFPGLPSPSSAAGASPGGSGFRAATQADIDDFLRRNPGDVHRIQEAFGNITDRHRGGWIDAWPRAHRGLWMDEVPIIAQTGERMLSRAEVARMGGRASVDAAASGGRDSAPVVLHVHLHANGRELASAVVEDLPGELKRRGFRL